MTYSYTEPGDLYLHLHGSEILCLHLHRARDDPFTYTYLLEASNSTSSEAYRPRFFFARCARECQ